MNSCINISSPRHLSISFTSMPGGNVANKYSLIHWFDIGFTRERLDAELQPPHAWGVLVKFFIVSNKFGTAYRVAI